MPTPELCTDMVERKLFPNMDIDSTVEWIKPKQSHSCETKNWFFFPNLSFARLIFIFSLSSSLTLSSPGFFGSSQPEGGGQNAPPPHHNVFVIGRITMKRGKLVKCFKLYLMMGFCGLIGCDVIMTS